MSLQEKTLESNCHFLEQGILVSLLAVHYRLLVIFGVFLDGSVFSYRDRVYEPEIVIFKNVFDIDIKILD